MNKIINSILVASVLVPVSGKFAQEGGLKMLMTFESASVLPVGIRNVRYFNAKIDAINKFNNVGAVVPMGSALNNTITWNTSLECKKDIYERATLEGLLDEKGIDKDQVIGNMTGMVNVAIVANVP